MINIPQPNWVPGLTRQGFGGESGEGEIGEFELLKAALRERPEYIIVGEIRGAEAYVLFQAMATGHCAYSTVHADSVPSLVHRLENKPIDIPRVLLPALEACSIQIQTRINGRRVRRTKQIVEIVGIDPNSMKLSPMKCSAGMFHPMISSLAESRTFLRKSWSKSISRKTRCAVN